MDAAAPHHVSTPFRRELMFVGVLVASNLLFDVGIWAAKSKIDDLYRSSVPPVYARADNREAFLIGCFMTQLVALAIVTALLSGPPLLRLLLGTLVLVSSLYGFAFALRSHFAVARHLWIGRSPSGLHEEVLQLLFLVVVFYLVQSPFWLLRSLLHLRIVRVNGGSAVEPRGRQYTLGQIFAMTAFFAFPLGLAATILPMFDPSRFGVRVLVLTGFSIVFGPLYLWAILGTRRLWRGLVALVLASILLSGIGGLAYWFWLPSRFPPPWWVVGMAFLFFQLGTLVVALGNGLPARWLGYRLVWSWPGRPSTISA